MLTSLQNNQVKYVHRIQTSSRFRREEGLFAAEGLRLVRELPPRRIRTIYCSASFLAAAPDTVSSLPVEPVVVSDAVFARMADTQNPQGILALAEMEETGYETLLSGNTLRLLYLENLQDPGNLGALLRTAEAAAFSGVVLSRQSVDLYNPKVLRGSMGAAFRVPVVSVDDLPAAIRQGREAGLTFFAAHLEGERDYDAVRYPEKTALLVGNEGNGLSRIVTACADEKIRIPMAGSAESLNAAVAASLLMYEVFRQARKMDIIRK